MARRKKSISDIYKQAARIQKAALERMSPLSAEMTQRGMYPNFDQRTNSNYRRYWKAYRTSERYVGNIANSPSTRRVEEDGDLVVDYGHKVSRNTYMGLSAG